MENKPLLSTHIQPNFLNNYIVYFFDFFHKKSSCRLQGSDLNPTATLTAHIIKPSSNGNLSDINQDTGIVLQTKTLKEMISFTFKQ